MFGIPCLLEGTIVCRRLPALLMVTSKRWKDGQGGECFPLLLPLEVEKATKIAQGVIDIDHVRPQSEATALTKLLLCFLSRAIPIPT